MVSAAQGGSELSLHGAATKKETRGDLHPLIRLCFYRRGKTFVVTTGTIHDHEGTFHLQELA